MVVLDGQNYINKAKDLLAQRDTCRPLTANPSNKHKKKLNNMLRTINAEEDWGTSQTKDFIQLAQASQILWATQDPQNRHPLRPILFSRGAISYEVAKELANISRPLVGHSSHHIRNT